MSLEISSLKRIIDEYLAYFYRLKNKMQKFLKFLANESRIFFMLLIFDHIIKFDFLFKIRI